MSRMTDDDLRRARMHGKAAYKNRMDESRVSVIYQSDVIAAGERAIESEARRRMAQEILDDARGKSVVEMFAMIERLAKES